MYVHLYKDPENENPPILAKDLCKQYISVFLLQRRYQKQIYNKKLKPRWKT